MNVMWYEKCDLMEICRNLRKFGSTFYKFTIFFSFDLILKAAASFLVLFIDEHGNQQQKIIFTYRVAFIFGSLTMLSGIIGVPLGAYLAQRLRKRHPRADPVICGFGLLISAPCIVAAMLLVSVNAPAAYCLIFFGEIALNLNWAIVADILLVRTNFQSTLFTRNDCSETEMVFVFFFFF